MAEPPPTSPCGEEEKECIPPELPDIWTITAFDLLQNHNCDGDRDQE